jgi:uncharacterized protein Usg
MHSKSYQPVLLQIIYYMPSHPSILQEFTWGYEDLIPDLIRTHRFLWHWKCHVDATISEILLSVSDRGQRRWNSVDEIFKLN